MAKIYGDYNAGQVNVPATPADPIQQSKTRTLSNRFNLSKQAPAAIGDQLVVGRASKGWSFRGGQIFTDVSFATATIAIGNASDVDKYKVAAVFTAVNTLTPLTGVITAGAFDPLIGDEEVLVTVAALALPAAGFFYVDLNFLVP